ncbi:MAG TPA: hypothetical protein VGT41_06270 [Candidatus Babeliales bacterium]|nr:hypothetical protein [Candidatus Babeliales bacterium]
MKRNNTYVLLMAGLLLGSAGQLFAATKEQVIGEMIKASQIVWSDKDVLASMYPGQKTKRYEWDRFLNGLGDYIRDADTTFLSDKKLIALFNNLKDLSNRTFQIAVSMSQARRQGNVGELTRLMRVFKAQIDDSGMPMIVQTGARDIATNSQKLANDLKALNTYRKSRLTSAKKKEAAGVLITFAEFINNHMKKIVTDYNKQR